VKNESKRAKKKIMARSVLTSAPLFFKETLSQKSHSWVKKIKKTKSNRGLSQLPPHGLTIFEACSMKQSQIK